VVSGGDEDTARILADAREALTRLAAEAHSLAEAAEKAERALGQTASSEGEDEPPSEPEDGEPSADLDDAETSMAAGAGEAAAPEVAAGPAQADRPNVDRARLSALNLALRGVPRDEAERRLAERFEVDGLDEILSEAYERAERAE
jgi:hypothetical protein